MKNAATWTALILGKNPKRNGMKQPTCKRKPEMENALQRKEADERRDQCGQWLEWTDKRIRCKTPSRMTPCC